MGNFQSSEKFIINSDKSDKILIKASLLIGFMEGGFGRGWLLFYPSFSDATLKINSRLF